MNVLVGERISIATFKAQTTRHRIMGIYNTDEMQIVFSDTPGVLKPNYKLQESMLNFSTSALTDADILLYVTDVVETPDKNNEFMGKVRQMTVPVLLLINKIDLTDQEKLIKLVEEWKELLPQAEIIPISAASKFNVDYVMKRIQELLPDSPPYFGKDQWTDKPARFFVNEIIREKILLYYDKEIPYSVEVVVEEFKEEAKKIHIRAVIYVERDSQKGIIIGKQGKVIQKICAECNCKVDVEEDGTVFISAIDIDDAKRALNMVETIANDPEVGAIYKGVVTRLMDFGAFVEIAPGKEGLVHISHLDVKHVDRVEDVVAVGDEVIVKVREIDDQGRLNLSRRDALIEVEGLVPENDLSDEPRRAPRRDNRGGRDGGRRDNRGGRGGHGGKRY